MSKKRTIQVGDRVRLLMPDLTEENARGWTLIITEETWVSIEHRVTRYVLSRPHVRGEQTCTLFDHNLMELDEEPEK